MRRALIVGANGQDGSYLAELLLEKGYEVHGTVRRSSHPNLQRLEGIRDRLHLHWADLSDAASLAAALIESEPDEVYNLGAMSDVRVSFDTPVYAGDVTGVGAVRLLELVRRLRGRTWNTRFYQAGSSEMFGMNPDVPTNESSAFRPGSPYAAAKVFAHHVATQYREAYGMFVATGILFNHESPRRGVEFVTRKITRAVADIAMGKADCVKLGSLEPQRDWGHARDYVWAMWKMLQVDTPTDFVIATGEAHSVREFAQLAFAAVGYDWSEFVQSDPAMTRPLDPPVLLGDSRKAAKLLGWKPTVGFKELVTEMVESDLKEAGA